MSNSDDDFMWKALHAARAAAEQGEVPVGAVAVRGGEVIATTGNRMESTKDALAHAELLCLHEAERVVGDWRLTDVSLYVTLEPCAMCAAAMVLCRLGRCVYGAADPKKGGDGSVYDVLRHPGNNHTVEVDSGVLAAEGGQLLTTFFQKLRASTSAKQVRG